MARKFSVLKSLIRSFFWVMFLVAGLQISSHAQTAVVNATNDLSCLGDRIGRNGICTANEFTGVVEFTQSSQTALSSCIAGTYIFVDLIATVSGTNTNRYDVAYFFGQTGNIPESTGGVCSVAPFPSTPSPFAELENSFVAPQDVCGDYLGGGSATLQMNQVKVLCQPAPGGAEVSAPYTIAWNAQQPYACNAANIIPKPDSKCLSGPANAKILGVTVQGYVKIVKATQPAGNTATFNFTASGSPGITISTSSFQLSHSQSMTVTIPMHSTTRSITVTEDLTSGWEPNTSVSCVKPDGSPANFVTIDNVNRRITANLYRNNSAAICTFTNTKQTRVRTQKTLVPANATGSFILSAATSVTTTSLSNALHTSATAYISSGTRSVTVTETATPGFNMNHYSTTVACAVDGSGTALPLISSDLVATTRTASVLPPQYEDVTCEFTNTRAANLTISKTNGQTTTVAGESTTYTIVVSNSGPAPADGAVLSDPAAPGLMCTAVSCQSISGGAVCPAGLDISSLQSGVAISSFPPNSSLSLTLACQVSATGT